MRSPNTIKSIWVPTALNGCVAYKDGWQYPWRDESDTIAPYVRWIYASSMDVTAERPGGVLEGVAIGQTVSDELVNGGNSNAANWLFVGGAIGEDACIGGEVFRIPDVYGTRLWAPGFDPEPSFSEADVGLSNDK